MFGPSMTIQMAEEIQETRHRYFSVVAELLDHGYMVQLLITPSHQSTNPPYESFTLELMNLPYMTADNIKGADDIAALHGMHLTVGHERRMLIQPGKPPEGSDKRYSKIPVKL